MSDSSSYGMGTDGMGTDGMGTDGMGTDASNMSNMSQYASPAGAFGMDTNLMAWMAAQQAAQAAQHPSHVEIPMIETRDTDHIDWLHSAIKRGMGHEIGTLVEVVNAVNQILRHTQPCESCGQHGQPMKCLATYEDRAHKVLCDDCQQHCPRCHENVGDGLGYKRHVSGSMCFPCSVGTREERLKRECIECIEMGQ